MPGETGRTFRREGSGWRGLGTVTCRDQQTDWNVTFSVGNWRGGVHRHPCQIVERMLCERDLAMLWDPRKKKLIFLVGGARRVSTWRWIPVLSAV